MEQKELPVLKIKEIELFDAEKYKPDHYELVLISGDIGYWDKFEKKWFLDSDTELLWTPKWWAKLIY